MVYIAMGFKKRYIFKSLFLLYFSFYAISPLCYSETQLDEAAVVTREPMLESKNIRLFLWEIMYSKMIPQKDSSDNTGNVWFIKKTRGILGSDNIIKINQENSASTEDTFILPTTQLYKTLFLNLSLPYKGFYPLFSGLSPPSV